MSMIGYLRQVSPGALVRLRESPDTLGRLVGRGFTMPAGMMSDEAVQRVLGTAPQHLREQLAAMLRPKGNDPGAGLSVEDAPPALSLEKAWHALHFLLTGSAGPTPTALGSALLGGEETAVDLGYGPVRILAPDDVATVAGALASLTPEVLAGRYDEAAMEQAGVYPGGWARDAEQSRDWLLGSFEQLRGYYAQARERGFGMLLYVA